MTKRLYEFLSAWLEWATETHGYQAPHGLPFLRCDGLCASTHRYFPCFIDADLVEAELGKLFRAEGLDKSYPFGGMAVHDRETREETVHLNEARLAWVRAKLSA